MPDMRRLTARDIQVFVAGALALDGLHALIRLPYYLTLGGDVGRLIASVVGGLALPLGIGILMESALALRLTQIYLWVGATAGCIALLSGAAVLRLAILRIPFVQSYTVDFLIVAILLVLLVWSKSRRFRDAHNA
jgi:hypothetical protein